ncbi:MAG TPA: UMP kinase [Candidatus Paceibacterota bacterium]|nr:UMP kinase [Candidatus Paceibacterota bacterium]
MEHSGRFLLKLSGEALTENGYRGIRRKPVDAIVREIKFVWPQYQIAVSVGGGNLYRGSQLTADLDLDPGDAVDADECGMVVTMVNGRMLTLMMRKAGIVAHHMMANPYPSMGEVFIMDKAVSRLAKGQVIVLSGGTGRPRVTTDTGAILSALQIRADMVLKGTKVDGIYDSDPSKNPDAVRIPYISYEDFLKHDPPLRILDTGAVSMARDNGLRIRVFNIFEPGALAQVLKGTGTYSEIGPAA